MFPFFPFSFFTTKRMQNGWRAHRENVVRLPAKQTLSPPGFECRSDATYGPVNFSGCGLGICGVSSSRRNQMVRVQKYMASLLGERETEKKGFTTAVMLQWGWELPRAEWDATATQAAASEPEFGNATHSRTRARDASKIGFSSVSDNSNRSDGR